VSLGSRWAVGLIAAATIAALSCHALAAHPGKPATAKSTPKSEAPKPLSQTLTGSAKADFEAAKLLANDGDFAGALIKFQSAYDASKDPRLLWNVAYCQKNLRRYSKVTATLKRYIEEGQALLSPGDKKEAEDLIAMIEPFTTRATIRVNEAGAEIFVDDELVGTSPLAAPVVLDIGERHLRVMKSGFTSFEKAVVVAGGPELKIDVALGKELHEGKVVVEAPAGAEVFIDDRRVGVGRVEQKVPSGGHQLRVSAPGMRPYQTEVIVQDKETRSLNVLLEPVAAGEKPTLRVAVGCADSEPRGPEDGLVVNVDGPDVLPPGAVKRKWSDQAKRNVVEYAQYAIAAGPHTLRIEITDCVPRDVKVDVDPAKGADVTGALESDRFVLLRGPQGTPGRLRAGAGLWMAFAGDTKNTPERYGTNGLDVKGAVLDLGLVYRWYGLFLDGSWGSGSFARKTFTTHYALPNPASVSWKRFLVRTGPRFPFYLASLGFGPLLGIESVDIDKVRTGKPSGIFGGYVELDVQPLCDWGLFASGTLEKPTDNDEPSVAVQIGLFYGPNLACHKERSTPFGLRASR
jgi:hypothetical protein